MKTVGPFMVRLYDRNSLEINARVAEDSEECVRIVCLMLLERGTLDVGEMIRVSRV
jgi:hypothetical protein